MPMPAHLVLGRPVPSDIRELRNQLERIRIRKRRQAQKYLDDIERARLRREITEEGETPCR